MRSQKKRHPILLAIMVFIGVVAIVGGSRSAKRPSAGQISKTGSNAETRTATMDTVSRNTQQPAVEPTTTTAPIKAPLTNWVEEYEKNGIEVLRVPSDVLYEYGRVYDGDVVVTAFNVDDKDRTLLKTTTENNETYSFSIVASFEDGDEIENISEDSWVMVIGRVEKREDTVSILGADKVVHMEDCHVVLKGMSRTEIDAQRDKQINYARQRTGELAEEEAANEQAVRQNYMDECGTLPYSDVERYPDRYKGEKAKVSGSVIQISEGWFDTVTIRVRTDAGDIWYISYRRTGQDEARILENDYLTFYGECDGVETYTAILGNSVTIPSLKAKYYQ